jgi:hypothetical protein
LHASLQDSMDPFASLSPDQLSDVLAHVDIKQRLSACSLVSTTWRAAAAQATTSITAQYTPAFGPWLRSHSAEVQVSSLHVTNNGSLATILQLALPLTQLRSLKALTLLHVPWRPGPEAAFAAAQPEADVSTRHSSSFKTKGLEQLTALTQLKLTTWSVELAGLSALKGLRELTRLGDRPRLPVAYSGPLQLGTSLVQAVNYYHPTECIPGVPGCAVSEAERELAAAFPGLQQLTSLTLAGNLSCSPLVVSHLSSLQSLWEIVLAGTDDDSPALSGCKLPQSITRLRWISRHGMYCLAPHSTAWLHQLTAMQCLILECVGPLDMSLLTSMRNLRSLNLWDVELTAGGSGLQALSCCTALTQLAIDGEREAPMTGRHSAGIPAAEAAALASSSQLVTLTLSGQPGRLAAPQDYSSLFPPRRQLPHLTALFVSANFLRDPTAVRQAASCCPNLQDVRLDKSYSNSILWGSPAEEARVLLGLVAMRGWAGLRQLMLGCTNPGFQWPNLLGAQFWQALGCLTQLTELYVHLPQQPEGTDVAHLASCRGLETLSVEYSGLYGGLERLKVVSTVSQGLNALRELAGMPLHVHATAAAAAATAAALACDEHGGHKVTN